MVKSELKLEVAAVLLSAVVMILAIALSACMLAPKPQGYQRIKAYPAWDIPMMNYPEYRMMMNLGATTIEFEGQEILVQRTDFSYIELRQLATILRAE